MKLTKKKKIKPNKYISTYNNELRYFYSMQSHRKKIKNNSLPLVFLLEKHYSSSRQTRTTHSVKALLLLYLKVPMTALTPSKL